MTATDPVAASLPVHFARLRKAQPAGPVRVAPTAGSGQQSKASPRYGGSLEGRRVPLRAPGAAAHNDQSHRPCLYSPRPLSQRPGASCP